MLVEATEAEASAAVAAMWSVASADGTEPLSVADRRGVAAAWHTVFGRHGQVDPDGLAGIEPAALAAVVADPALRLTVVRCLACMAFVDGVVEDTKLTRVLAFAEALAVRADFVDALAHLLRNDIAWVAFDEIRHNVETIPGMAWDPEDPYGPFLPYRGGRTDPALTERYRALERRSAGSLGRAFWEHYQRNGFAFPGEAAAVAEVWATPHDTLHVLSGYSTSAQGELLVAAFTAAARHDDTDMMESHVLPTILIYHLGIDINKGMNAGDQERIAADPSWRDNYQGNVHLGLDPAKLWVAWDRGAAMTTDVYDGRWSFFDHVDEPVDELRRAYGIAPLDPVDAAVDDDAVDRSAYLRPGMPPPPELGPDAIRER